MPLGRRNVPAAPLMLSAAFAIFSIAIQGYYFGLGNNAFHIPIVLQFYDDPVFRDDYFIGTLRNYVSLVWPFVSLWATDRNIWVSFFALHLLSRMLFYYSVIEFTRALTPHSPATLVVVCAVFAFSYIYQQASLIGASGQQVPYFSHSELCAPLVILSLLWLRKTRPIASFALCGLTFDLNAFVGIWLLAVLAILIVWQRQSWREFAWCACVFLLVATPEIYWIARLLIEAAPFQPFDYAEYLRGYYPDHSFIAEASARHVVEFSAMLVAACWALRALATSGFWRLAFAGFVGVFVFGAALPYLTHSRLLLNLFPLRSDAILAAMALVFVLIAASMRGRRALIQVAAAALTGYWVTIVAVLLVDALPLRRPVVSVLTLLAALTAVGLWCADGRWGAFVFAAAGAAIAATYWERFGAAALSLPVAALILHAVDLHRADGWLDFRRPYWLAWQEVQQWAADATPPGAMFMIPLDMRLVGFQNRSRHPLYVDLRQGAAVMWQPAFYAQWSSRVADLRALSDTEQRLRYACQHGIDFVVEWRADATVAGEIHANELFSVFAVTEHCRR